MIVWEDYQLISLERRDADIAERGIMSWIVFTPLRWFFHKIIVLRFLALFRYHSFCFYVALGFMISFPSHPLLHSFILPYVSDAILPRLLQWKRSWQVPAKYPTVTVKLHPFMMRFPLFLAMRTKLLSASSKRIIFFQSSARRSTGNTYAGYYGENSNDRIDVEEYQMLAEQGYRPPGRPPGRLTSSYGYLSFSSAFCFFKWGLTF